MDCVLRSYLLLAFGFLICLFLFCLVVFIWFVYKQILFRNNPPSNEARFNRSTVV
uniref:Putative membrane-binding protein n=1 Tax=Beet yellows virus TaxID=12161 RepID=Q65893_9CLOS|nr:unnamed protein product [Beet yellows virus]